MCFVMQHQELKCIQCMWAFHSGSYIEMRSSTSPYNLWVLAVVDHAWLRNPQATAVMRTRDPGQWASTNFWYGLLRGLNFFGLNSDIPDISPEMKVVKFGFNPILPESQFHKFIYICAERGKRQEELKKLACMCAILSVLRHRMWQKSERILKWKAKPTEEKSVMLLSKNVRDREFTWFSVTFGIPKAPSPHYSKALCEARFKAYMNLLDSVWPCHDSKWRARHGAATMT